MKKKQNCDACGELRLCGLVDHGNLLRICKSCEREGNKNGIKC